MQLGVSNTSNNIFKNRGHAGEQLAEELLMYKKVNPVILALPRGGVSVAKNVSKRLDSKMNVIVSRKVTVESKPELGVGAISEDGAFVFEDALLKKLKISNEDFHKLLINKAKEVENMVSLYRGGKPLQDMEGEVIIIVDDGLATGVTARAALLAVSEYLPRKVVFATPVCSMEASYLIRNQVDDFICLNMCDNFGSVSSYYDNFDQLTDNQVVRLLNEQEMSTNFAI